MILLLSTSDTDLLSARASGAALTGWPTRPAPAVDDLPALLDGADLVVVRILGGRRAWEEGLDALLAGGLPVVVLGGEQAPDAELMELSTVPAGVAAEAHAYLAHGGPANLAELHDFLSDTVLLTGHGFAPPAPDARPGGRCRDRGRDADGPDGRGALLPGPPPGRQHRVRRGALPAIEDGRRRGRCRCSARRCVRAEPEPARRRCGRADALVVTVLAAGGTRPADRRRPAATTRRGTSARSPTSTCRSCRPCA